MLYKCFREKSHLKVGYCSTQSFGATFKTRRKFKHIFQLKVKHDQEQDFGEDTIIFYFKGTLYFYFTSLRSPCRESQSILAHLSLQAEL